MQLFGDRLNFHPHLHVLSTDGVFSRDGFHRLPLGPEDLAVLRRIFSEYVFRTLIPAGKITPAVREDMLAWRHSGLRAAGLRLLAPLRGGR